MAFEQEMIDVNLLVNAALVKENAAEAASLPVASKKL